MNRSLNKIIFLNDLFAHNAMGYGQQSFRIAEANDVKGKRKEKQVMEYDTKSLAK